MNWKSQARQQGRLPALHSQHTWEHFLCASVLSWLKDGHRVSVVWGLLGRVIAPVSQEPQILRCDERSVEGV